MALMKYSASSKFYHKWDRRGRDGGRPIVDDKPITLG